MVSADAVIAAAYFSIPIATLSYVRKRPKADLNWVAWLFSAFIFACGMTHVMGIWTIWRPDYPLQALSKIVTAAISLVTAVALWPLIPKALETPSVQQLQAVIGSLEEEIGRRRTAEDQLAAIQQNLALTLASIDAGFISTDRAGKVTHMNAVAESVTGWQEHEALGRDLWAVFEREGRPTPYLARNPVDVMLEQGLTMESMQRVVAVSRTGVRTPLEVKAAPTRNDLGEVTGLVTVFRDRSRLIKAVDDEKRLAAIVESTSDAIIGETLDGTITSWNGGAQTLYGYTAAEVVGKSVQVILPPDRASEEAALLASLAQGIGVPTFDTVRLAKDGGRREVSVTMSPIRDDEGRVVGVAKIARNMSVQRRAAAALRDSESLLRTIHMHFIVSITDRAGRITEVNDSFCAISGYGRDELLGQTHRIINSGVQPAEFWFDLWRTISAGRPWRGEICNRAKSGSLYWVDSVIAPFAGADGKIEKYISIRTDITLAKRAEGARLETLRLEAENRQIREASRLKSQFLANMSHELRTPLNAVIGFADLLHSGFIKPDSPKHQEFLGHIGTSGRHLLQLINDVLDLSKVESGKFDFFPEPLDLSVVLKEVQDILHTAISRKRIHLSIDIDADLTDLNLDPARLKQVLYNYLSNAIKFTDSGGHVAVRAMGQGPEHFRIEVEDSGIGISAADLPRLFSEFQQLDAGYSKQHEGTGLGLALTRRLVQAQGGEVGARSTVGAGSVFYLVLNRQHGLDPQRTDHFGPLEAGREVNRFLVIEGQVGDQARMVQAFSQAGFAVDAESDVPHALRRARETAYTALTLGLRLHEQPGLGLLANIRSSGASHATPVVGVTMPTEPGTSAGFAIANVLSKPIRSNEIVSALAPFKLVGEVRANVMVIDDEQASLDLMRATLKSIGIDTACFLDGRVALQEIDQHRPDAIVLDLMMPGFDGFQVLDALQRLPRWREVPVFIWTSMLLTDDEYATLARSARGILIKGGGAMEAMLESVGRWRQPLVPGPGKGQP
jgi:PAS domain S-box-containing protein